MIEDKVFDLRSGSSSVWFGEAYRLLLIVQFGSKFPILSAPMITVLKLPSRGRKGVGMSRLCDLSTG